MARDKKPRRVMADGITRIRRVLAPQENIWSMVAWIHRTTWDPHYLPASRPPGDTPEDWAKAVNAFDQIGTEAQRLREYAVGELRKAQAARENAS